MTSKIIVVGSSNTDMVVKADKLPAKGETVIGGKFLMNPGGKGANQAVAAARLGGQVVFVTKVGNDIFGKQAVQGFGREGMQTTFVYTDADHPSGIALIGVDATGENSIMVAPGANAHLRSEEVMTAIQANPGAGWLLIQLEIPMATVKTAIRQGALRGLKVILNPAPAPAQPLSSELLGHLFVITPNESETELLTGIRVTDLHTARQAAEHLFAQGVANVVITLGSRGVFVKNASVSKHIPAPVVEALDTTAAGDVFNGALVVALAENQPIEEAAAFACQAAALSVTRMGAQASIPLRKELPVL
jgi:ribokinase